jgi:hypothetical protein
LFDRSAFGSPPRVLTFTVSPPIVATHFGAEVSYSKNWIFKSETLWYDRWQQVLAMQDQIQFLEIVTWNDYGESHYGELREELGTASLDVFAL